MSEDGKPPCSCDCGCPRGDEQDFGECWCIENKCGCLAEGRLL